jgi:hypothetical protein
MINIKTLTKQDYDKNHKSPSEIVFYKNEKDLCHIIGLHLAKNLKESLSVAQKFISLSKEAEVYETENDGKFLYIIKTAGNGGFVQVGGLR